MAKLNKNLTGTQITDEVINRSGSTGARLEHDTIFNDGTFEIWTAAGGTGTQLTLTTDYTLGDEDTTLTSQAGSTVYTTVAIVNGTYQNTDLYVTYKTIGDYVEAADVNRPPSIGDFDISATNATPSALTVPNRFRVSWNSGDGSNTFSFSDTTGITLDGVALSEWVGEGTGYLEIETGGGSSWQNVGPDIWDSDYGNFSYRFEKSERKITLRFTDTSSASPSFTKSWPRAFSNASIDVSGVSNEASRSMGLSNITATQYDIQMTDPNVAAYAAAYSVTAVGNWTTTSPRRS